MIGVQEIHVHPLFDEIRRPLSHDVAVAVTSEDIPFSQWTQPIKVPNWRLATMQRQGLVRSRIHTVHVGYTVKSPSHYFYFI